MVGTRQVSRKLLRRPPSLPPPIKLALMPSIEPRKRARNELSIRVVDRVTKAAAIRSQSLLGLENELLGLVAGGSEDPR